MTTYLTPFNDATPVDLGRVWRKQVWKFGKIRTNDGTELDLNTDLANACVEAYKDGAFDQVPFQLVKDDNAHNSDPERYRGEIKGFEVTGEGLDLLLDPSERGDQLLRENPRLGVSARIVPNYTRSDGKTFRAAIEHVAGTLNPVVTGTRPWEAVNLSSTDGGAVIDFSTEESISMPDTEPTTEQPVEPTDASIDALLDGLSDEDLQKLADEELTDEEKALLNNNVDPEGDETEPEGDDVTETVEQPAGDLVTAGADLSADAKTAIDLANKAAKDAQDRTSALEQQLAQEKADREADAYLAAGVPPADIDLARPALALTGQVIDLSNGSKTDTGVIIRGLLNSRKGTVDLSGEKGHSDLSADEKVKHDELMAAWEKQSPTK